MKRNEKKIVYVDMDDTLCDFAGKWFEKRSIEVQWPQSVPGFFTSLPPLFGAVESVKELAANPLYDVWFLTAPSVYNPLSYTEKRLWIEYYFGFQMCHRLILSPNKALLKGDYLIDDCAYGKGQESFEGKLIQYGSSMFPNWSDVMRFLEEESAKA